MIGLGKRLSYALQCFVSVLSHGEIPAKVVEDLVPAPDTVASLPAPDMVPIPPAPEPSTDPGHRAVQILALLQRDGRLIDFFTEDIASYSDAQIGAAARQVHESCRHVLERYLALEPIIASAEGQPVTVAEDVDPATTKLIGNVTGTLPLRGVLRHRGWRVSRVELPPLPEGAGRAVVAPAEVEMP